MMRAAKIAIAGLLAFVLAGSLFACSQQNGEQSGDEVTIVVKVPTLSFDARLHPEVATAYDFACAAAAQFEENYEGANVNVEVVEFPIEGETDVIESALGTSDAPDVLFESYFNMGSYVYTGYVVPLDDVITEEVRADIPEAYWEMSQVDGKTYLAPFMTSINTLVFNKRLLDAAGLQEYTQGAEDAVITWTPAQWDTVLSTLRSSLSGTQYPMMMYAANEQGDTHLMTLLRSKGSAFYGDDGRFNVNTPEGVAALRWIKESYDKGYFPEGADTLSINDNYSLFVNGQIAIYVSNSTQDESIRTDGGFEPLTVNFPSPDGGLATSFVTGFEVFDNGDDEKIRISKDFVSYVLTSDLMDYSVGAIPVSSRVMERYSDELSDVQKYIDDIDASWNFTGNHPNWRGVREIFYKHIQDMLFGTMTPEETAVAIDADCNAAIDEGYAANSPHE